MEGVREQFELPAHVEIRSYGGRGDRADEEVTLGLLTERANVNDSLFALKISGYRIVTASGARGEPIRASAILKAGQLRDLRDFIDRELAHLDLSRP